MMVIFSWRTKAILYLSCKSIDESERNEVTVYSHCWIKEGLFALSKIAFHQLLTPYLVPGTLLGGAFQKDALICASALFTYYSK